MMRRVQRSLSYFALGLNYKLRSIQWSKVLLMVFGMAMPACILVVGFWALSGPRPIGQFNLEVGYDVNDAIARADINTSFSFKDMAERRAVAKLMDHEWPPEEPEWLSKFRKPEDQADIRVLEHRSPEDFPKEILAYISQLDITDPVFYDVFSDPEIYSLFRPESEIRVSRIPFYIWDDTGDILKALACKTAKGAPEGDLRDGYQSLYTDLKDHPWRTFNKDEALFFYVPLPEAFLHGYNDACHPPCDVTKLIINDIIASREWKRYNGMNFFWVSSSYRNDIAARKLERRRVAGDRKPLSSRDQFLMQAMPFFEASNSHFHPCIVNMPFSPPWTSRAEKPYPQGKLESYQQDLGESFMLKRPINFFFIGQADRRRAYWSRRQAIDDLWNTTGLSMLASTSKQQSKPSHVEIVNVMTGCGEYTNSSEHFDCLMRRSMFGLHLRGDEFASGRLAALMGSGTLPIIVMEEAQDISVQAQCNVPWRDLAIFVNETAWKANATEALRVALEPLTAKDMAKRYRLMEYYREYSVNALWWTKFPTYLFQEAARRCMPERILRDHGLQHRKLICPFEDRTQGQTFTPVTPDNLDEDDPQPSWGAHWACHDVQGQCDRKPSSLEDMKAARRRGKYGMKPAT